MMFLYAVHDDFDGQLSLESVEVKETPGGYRALERSGLAFSCRTRFGKDDYATTPAGAYRRFEAECRARITHAQEDIQEAERGLLWVKQAKGKR
jgi:hypothetical protein